MTEGHGSHVSPPGYPPRRALVGWALFDWANQPYFTLITTFIFAPYFAITVIGDAVEGQTLWAYAQLAAGLIIAITAPIVGAISDVQGPRKPWIAVCTVAAMAAMAALWGAEPGATGSALPILIAVVVAAVGVELSTVFNNAMLPRLAPASRIGRLSGFGWGLGYAGGLITLLIVVFLFEQPWLGLDLEGHEPARLTGPLSAVWLGVFILPLFFLTPDSPRSGQKLGPAISCGLQALVRTVREAAGHKNILTFLIARMLYIDGLSAIFAFGGIYAAGVFGWETRTLGLYGIVLIVFSMLGAFLGGRLDDRIGSKRTVILGLFGLLVGTVGILSVSADKVLFVFDVAAPAPAGALFAAPSEQVMLAFSVILGFCGGPVQAASRTLLARLAPQDKTAEFFGLYALSGKATAFAAPLAVGITTAAFQSQRAGLAVVVVFLIAGLALFWRVREPGE